MYACVYVCMNYHSPLTLSLSPYTLQQVRLSAFPSFYFFTVDTGKHIEYMGERAVGPILNFLQTHRSQSLIEKEIELAKQALIKAQEEAALKARLAEEALSQRHIIE